MNKDNVEYKVVYGTSYRDIFDERVTEMLRAGWELQGGVCCTGRNGGEDCGKDSLVNILNKHASHLVDLRNRNFCRNPYGGQA